MGAENRSSNSTPIPTSSTNSRGSPAQDETATSGNRSKSRNNTNSSRKIPTPTGPASASGPSATCSQSTPTETDETDHLQVKFSPELCDFVGCCLKRDPTKRSTAIELQCHPWIRRMFETSQYEVQLFLKQVMRENKNI
jgi:serine/threonine protein kinase